MNFIYTYNKQTPPDVLILADGDFPSHPVNREMLKLFQDRIICCDGASDHLLNVGYIPQAVIGDGDSISKDARQELAERIHIEEEQDTNDLTKAVRYVLKKGDRRLLIMGATGKREDHTLGNISLLADYMDMATVEMWTDYGIFTPVTGHRIFPSYIGQQLSVFCMDNAPLTLRNVRWPIEQRIITRWWQATLNEALSESFEVDSSGKVIVFRTH